MFQMSEEEQVVLASRLGVIEQLPTGTYVESPSKKAAAECVINGDRKAGPFKKPESAR